MTRRWPLVATTRPIAGRRHPRRLQGAAGGGAYGQQAAIAEFHDVARQSPRPMGADRAPVPGAAPAAPSPVTRSPTGLVPVPTRRDSSTCRHPRSPGGSARSQNWRLAGSATARWPTSSSCRSAPSSGTCSRCTPSSASRADASSPESSPSGSGSPRRQWMAAGALRHGEVTTSLAALDALAGHIAQLHDHQAVVAVAGDDRAAVEQREDSPLPEERRAEVFLLIDVEDVLLQPRLGVHVGEGLQGHVAAGIPHDLQHPGARRVGGDVELVALDDEVVVEPDRAIGEPLDDDRVVEIPDVDDVGTRLRLVRRLIHRLTEVEVHNPAPARLRQLVDLVADEQEVLLLGGPTVVREHELGHAEAGEDLDVVLVGDVPDLGLAADGILERLTLTVAAVEHEQDLPALVVLVRPVVDDRVEVVLADVGQARHDLRVGRVGVDRAEAWTDRNAVGSLPTRSA